MGILVLRKVGGFWLACLLLKLSSRLIINMLVPGYRTALISGVRNRVPINDDDDDDDGDDDDDDDD